MTYACKQALETRNLDSLKTLSVSDVVSHEEDRLCPSESDISMIRVETDTAEGDSAEADSWETVAQNVESAINAMERVAQYVGQNSRNKLSYSLRRCYLRARSIREMRGLLHVEDQSDHDHYLANKCMLGNYLRGDF